MTSGEGNGSSVADSGGSQPQEAVKSDGPRSLVWRPVSDVPPDEERVLILLDPTRYGVPVWIDEWDGFIGVWKAHGDAGVIGWMPLPSFDGKES